MRGRERERERQGKRERDRRGGSEIDRERICHHLWLTYLWKRRRSCKLKDQGASAVIQCSSEGQRMGGGMELLV